MLGKAEVVNQPEAPAALTLRKETLIPVKQTTGWTQVVACTFSSLIK
jgi:hypothetical protein